MNDLLSTKRVAKRLGVSIWMIYDLIKSEGMPFYSLGHGIVFSEKKAFKWLETRRNLGYGGKMAPTEVDAIEKAPYPPRKPFGYN